jgi:hypothetical protein
MSQPISINLEQNDPFLDANAFAELDVQLRGDFDTISRATDLARSATDGCSGICTIACGGSLDEVGIPAF